MKKMNIAGKLLSTMLLGSLLAGCQNDDVLSPSNIETDNANDVNAKTATLPVKLLVEDGGTKLNYIKSGRYTGRLGNVVGTTGTTTYYSYSDGYNGESFIFAETKNNTTGASTAKISYKLANGHCVKMADIKNNKSYTLTYGLSNSEAGRLEKIQEDGSSNKTEFGYNVVNGVYRLNQINLSNASGIYKQINVLYQTEYGNGAPAPIPDKYFLNPEPTGLDKYLPIFGQFSDVLVKAVTVKSLPDVGQLVPYYKLAYFLNPDGTVESRWKTTYPFGYGSNINVKTDIFNQKYGYPTGI